MIYITVAVRCSYISIHAGQRWWHPTTVKHTQPHPNILYI